MTENLPPGPDRARMGHDSPVRPTGVTLMNLANKRDPKALLVLLRAQLRKSPRTPELLLTAADTALMAAECEEAIEYSKELVLATGDVRGMRILVDALYQLGRKVDLDALWERLAPTLSNGLHDGPTNDPAGEEENPFNKIRMTLAQHLLKRGDLAKGMELRRSLRSLKSRMAHPLAQKQEIPWWSGRDEGSPLLVISEQGLGEQILWAVAFEELSERHPGSVVECSVSLLPVFQRSFPSLRFVSYESGEITRIVGIEYRKVLASELDHALGTRTKIECPQSWLKSDSEKTRGFRRKYQRLSAGKRLVGLSWRSHHPHYGEYKSIPLELFGGLLKSPDCDFFSLQYGDVSFDLRAAYSAGAPVPRVDDAVDAMTDLDTWLAQVAAMDVVVTTSNTTAHASTALGIPTILILPSPVNVFYYWGYEGNKTPWYPSTMEIVRSNGDRATAVDAACNALRREQNR